MWNAPWADPIAFSRLLIFSEVGITRKYPEIPGNAPIGPDLGLMTLTLKVWAEMARREARPAVLECGGLPPLCSAGLGPNPMAGPIFPHCNPSESFIFGKKLTG
jgi:hypothetical protein